ncbi:protein fantom-like isoform X2 [Clavelina lepadiformis]|uniref:protein fantom-like isoform X2 n=1 Tax=Clavelina lepadiformis TaxID=159417 RepID=UPI004042101B
MTAKNETQQRTMVAKLPREELEDQHLRILDENHILKSHGRKQEEKIKRMATKLLRLASDRKKLAAMGGERRTGREVDLEEKIELQQETIRDINKENEALKQKMRVMHQQMSTQGKRQTPYSGVQSRIDSRVPKRPDESPRSRTGGRTYSDKMSTRTVSPQPNRYGHSLLEEARNENHRLHQQLLALHEQIARMEEETQGLRKDILKNNANHENELLKVHEHVNSSKKVTLSDNIEIIKVQRLLKEKSNELISSDARLRELHANYERLRDSYNSVIHEMERLKAQVADEERKNLSLQNSLKHGGGHQRTIVQLQEHVRELENEVAILKDANDKLTDSAFDREKEQQWREMERKLRTQIAQLEVAIKADMSDKNIVLERISNERGYVSRIHSDSRKAHGELDRLKHENQDLRERLKLYSAADDSVNVEELREALSVIRQRRHAAAQRERPDFLESIDDGPKDINVEFSELQAQHAETIQELDKTREMLLMQHKINKDYQMEVENVSNQLEEVKRGYEEKLDRNARLLDARAARIKKLENQLHDVAYGTKQFKFQPDNEWEVDSQLDETIQLERGENLFEINVSKVTLTKDAQIALDDRNPSLFVTYAFYDYELVSTPIQKSASPLFDFTAQFTVKVNDLFLHHLQKESTIFELHQAMGIEHTTIAACKIKFNQLLDKPHGKLHGSASLTGLDGSNYGSLDFWVRLRVPMDQAIRLYRERTKALGYLSANTAATRKTLEVLDSQMEVTSSDNSNQILLQIISCNHVMGRREGVQPNIYCVYKFFDFADHDTNIIPSTNNPHFDDRQAYPVHMNSDLDAYLKSEKLVIYVFDDTDPEVSSYLGKALIDLLPLAHNKIIKAPFQLIKRDGSDNGTVEVGARWQLPYKSPEGVMKSEKSVEEDKEINEAQKLMKKPPVTPKKRHVFRNVATKLPKPSQPALQPIQTPHHEPTRVLQDNPGPLPKKEESILLDDSELEKPKEEPPAKQKTVEKDQPEEMESEIEEEISEELEESDHPDEEVQSDAKESVRSAEKVDEDEKDDTQDEVASFDDEDDETEPLKVAQTKQNDKDVDADKLEIKKVTLVEPGMEKPIPLARTTRSLKPIQKVDVVDDEDVDSLEEILQNDEFPKPIQVTSKQDSSVRNVKTPSPTTKEEESKTLVHEDDDISEVESMDSQILVVKPEKKMEARQDEEDDRDEQSGSPHQNEEESEIEEDIEEIPDDTGGASTDLEETDGKDETVEEDSKEVKTAPGSKVSDTVHICINHLTLDPNTSVWEDDEIEKLFIEYDFLGTVEETPDAVDKPQNKEEKLMYTFDKKMKVDALEHSEQRNLLSTMMTSGHTSFKMTVVSEPANDEEGDCEEIGTATVDFAAILEDGCDIIDGDVPVQDLRNPDEVVGKLNVTIEALAVLRAIKEELHARLRESDS